MTAPTAAVVSTKLVELFDNVPEYVDYDCDDVVKDLESDYRIALGKVVKSWGDQLLDLAEQPPSPLTRNEARTIDALLERISEVFEQLNSFVIVELEHDDQDRRDRLRKVDGQILQVMEESASLMRELQARRGMSMWLSERAGKMYRRLRRVARELRHRNRVLAGDVHSGRRDDATNDRHVEDPR